MPSRWWRWGGVCRRAWGVGGVCWGLGLTGVAGGQVLFLAAMAGNADMVEALVGLKANLEAQDKLKFTPLMAAAASGNRRPSAGGGGREGDMVCRGDEACGVRVRAGARFRASFWRLVCAFGASFWRLNLAPRLLIWRLVLAFGFWRLVCSFGSRRSLRLGRGAARSTSAAQLFQKELRSLTSRGVAPRFGASFWRLAPRRSARL